jgi:ribonuclease HI
MVSDKKFNFNVKHWKFLSGRVRENAVGSMFFSGFMSKSSLTGGCGWWVVDEDVVIAYGAAPVIQAFPSLIRLEYEALLNGMQAAIRKGLRHIVVKSANNLILTRLSGGMDHSPLFTTIDRDIRDIYAAILRSLNQFLTVDFELIPAEEAYYSQKLAEKAIHDQAQQREAAVIKKQNETPPANRRAPLSQVDELVARSYDEEQPVVSSSSDLSAFSTDSFVTAQFADRPVFRSSSGPIEPPQPFSPGRMPVGKTDPFATEEVSFESPKGINFEFPGWQLFA